MSDISLFDCERSVQTGWTKSKFGMIYYDPVLPILMYLMLIRIANLPCVYKYISFLLIDND